MARFKDENLDNLSQEFKAFMVLNPEKVENMQGRSFFYLLYPDSSKSEPYVYEYLTLFDDQLYGNKTGVASYNFRVSISIMPILSNDFSADKLSFDYVSARSVDIYCGDVCFASAKFSFNDETLKEMTIQEQKDYFEKYVRNNLTF